MSQDTELLLEEALAYLKGRGPRSKREIQEAVHAAPTEMSRLIHRMRESGRVRTVTEDDGITMYALAEQPATSPAPAPKPQAAPAPAPEAPRRIAVQDTSLDPLFERVMALMSDGKGRTFREMAEGVGLDGLPAAVSQRVARRCPRVNSSGAKGGRGMEGVYALKSETKPTTKPLPVATWEEVQEIVIQAPPAPVHAQEPAKVKEKGLVELLDDAISVADAVIEDYLDSLKDERLNSLIQTARHLRDARAALG